MSLSNENFKTIFNCTGGLTYDTDFKIFEDADAEVILYTISTGAETPLTLTTHYTISLKTETGFRVTTVTAYSTLYKLIVRRKQPLKQEIDYTQNDTLSTEVLEKQLDKEVMMIQGLRELINRGVLQDASKITPLDLPIPEGGKYLGWNAAGTALDNKVSGIVVTTGTTEMLYLNNYASYAAAIAAIGVSEAVLVLDVAGTVSVNTITPITLHQIFTKKGALTIATGITLTINGPVDAGLYQIFNCVGIGKVVFGDNSLSEVRPEWWTTNTTPGTTDMTTALTAALTTGKNVQLNGCIYGTTGLHRISTNGQQLLGVGNDIAGAVKTVIKKLSGTNYILDTIHSINGIALKDICFDRNSLNGSGIIWRGHYSEVKNVSFKTVNSTGTGVDLHLSGVNLSQFNKIDVDSLLIDQSSDTYLPIPSYGCLYSSFKNISVLGTFEMMGVVNMGLTFDDMYVENNGVNPSIYIHGSNNACLYFNNLKSESILRADSLIKVTAGIYNIHFSGGRLSENAAQSQAVFEFNGVQDITISKMDFNDPYSNAGKDIISLTNVYQVTIEDNEASGVNNYVFIHNIAASEYITSRGNKARIYAPQTGVGTTTFTAVDHLTIERDAFKPTIGGTCTYVNISDTLNIHSQRSAGVITVADDGYYDIFGDGGVTSPGAGFMGLISISAMAISATSINNHALFYAQCSTTTVTQLHTNISVGSNVEIQNIADNTAAVLATTTDGKLGVQIGGGNATTRYIRIYNRTGVSVNLRVHVDRYQE